MSTTFVTGATGFLGSALVAALLERGDDDVIALVRARDDEAAEARLDQALARIFGAGPVPSRARLRAVRGDLSRPGLGLGAVPEITTIVHCGASISFDLPLVQARRVNVDGTLAVLDLAARTGARTVHVSTAYVSGARPGRFGEDDLDLDRPFRNSYEHTKAEAELLVRGAGLDVAVARPSIVVGESGSGWTSAFNVLYFPLRAFARGLLDVVPADPRGLIDAITVDAVVAGLLALHDNPGLRSTYALAAGPAAVTVAQLAHAASHAFGRPEPRFAEADITEKAGDGAAVYLPYFDVRTEFGVERGHALLREAGAVVRPITEYLDELVGYAAASKWGKLAVPRVRARELAAAA